MSFPLGKTILALICIALVSGAVVFFHAPPRQADLTLWVFADPHARMYRGDFRNATTTKNGSLLDQFQKETGHSVRLDLIAREALDIRLISLFMSASPGRGPDLAEIEIGSIGEFFRTPTEDVGFLPLNGYLEKSGWMNRIVPTRFAPWSKDATIFGIPHDMHPCTISYRKDLFDEAGVDLESATSWPIFQTRCLQFQQYWHAHRKDKSAIGLAKSVSDQLMVLLLQQHVNLIDSDLSIHLADEKVLTTLLWYVQAILGKNQISSEFNTAPGQDIRDLANGDICAMLTPDWQTGYIRQYGPDMKGKLHMIPLPKFSPSDAPTASWGGTMIGITRNCKQPDLAWKLIEKLYLDRDALQIRQQSTNILPPIPEYWSDPIYQTPDPIFAGQKVSLVYLNLASSLPARYVTAYSVPAQTILSVVLNRAEAHMRSQGTAGLEETCRRWLTDGAESLKETIAFDQAGM
jgi:arabinosaccharide transport system substrate-binding protein